MKKLILFFLFASLLMTLQAQVIKKVNIETPGGLSASQTTVEKNTITNLIITGTIDARDFKTMRDEMPNLASVDLSGVNIANYTGNAGTMPSVASYPASEIPNYAFYSTYNFTGKRTLRSFVYPVSVTSIGSFAFSDCSGLTTMVIPTSVTLIRPSAFANCTGLSSVTIPSSVITIQTNAFYYCINLNSLIISEGVASIGESAFSNCGSLTSVTIPTSVTSIESYAFSNCYKLSSATISEGVTSIKYNAFGGCTSLSSISIPSSVTSIERYAFSNCSKLKSLTISDGVTSIGESVFNYCIALDSINAESSVPLDLSFSNNIFNGVNKSTCKLYVPYKTKSLYAASYQWKDFVNIIENTSGVKLSSNKLSFPATPGSNASVEISSNVVWNASSNQDWLIVNPTSGSNDHVLEIIASANPTVGARTAKVTVSVPGSYSQTITITQDAQPLIKEIKPGELSSALTAEEKRTIAKLILTGTIDARDFKTMRDEMPNLSIIDLSGISIVGYTGIEGTLSNSTIYLANEIPSYSFRAQYASIGKTSLTSFIFPSSVTSIGESAFFGCTGLIAANIPSSVTSFGNYAFANCVKLISVSIPEGVTTIGNNAFSNCNSFNSVTIPSSVKLVGDYTFSYCVNLSSVNISEGVTLIGNSVFSGCSNLSSIIIPSSVKSLGNSVFAYCVNLNSATIPEGITSIRDNMFSNCNSLTSIIIPLSVDSIGNKAFYYCNKLRSVVIPEKVISIGQFAFSYCTSLTSFSIPFSVAIIGSSAFSNCTGLKAFTIPASVTSIGESAFSGCSALVSINAGFSVPLDLSSLKSVFGSVNKTSCKLYVPYNTKILYAAASQWKDFTNIIESTTGIRLSSNIVTLPVAEGSKASVDVIANVAWTASSNQAWLTVNPTSGDGNGTITFTATVNPATLVRTAKITISVAGSTEQTITVTQEAQPMKKEIAPGGLSTVLTSEEKRTITNLTLTGTIDARDFKTMRDEMPNLTTVDLNGASIAAYTGNAGTLSNNAVYLKNEIPENAFSNRDINYFKTKLKSFVYPISVTSISTSAFYGCAGLTSTAIPSSVTSIGKNAFYNCTKLISVNIPERVSSIGESTFYGCVSLITITIPASVKSIGAYAFYNCLKLSSISIPEGVSLIGNNAFYNCIGLTSVNIPSTVSSIGSNAFYTCKKLSSLTISEGVARIGQSAFYGCSELISAIIPASVDSIGNSAFYNCMKLSSASISEGVSSIGNSAFYNCNSLKSVTIPSSVTSIGGYAFGYCNALNSVTAGYSVPLNLSNSQNVFYNVNTSTCKLNVPFNTKSLYAAASQWKNFTNIIESTVGFKLSSNIVKLADTSGSRTSVDVTSNIAWTATSNQTWLSISPTSGNGNGSIEITASANPEPKVRNAKITISGTGVSSQTISVAQEAKALSLEIAPGELAKALSQIEKATITKLKLTGKIDARDFKTMRDGMPKLTIIDLNEVNIVAYSGYEGTVYNTTTYPDNQIPQNAFCSSNNSSDAKAGLTSFIYPSSATSVGEYAFNGCSGLTFVTIPSSVDSIGRNAYSNCQNLSYINFPEGIIKIGNSAFYNCGSLGSIAIPSSVTTIEANAFSTCGKLSSAIISEGVTSIGESAFTNCVSLTSVTIPSSVLSIGKNAFNTCEKLVTANISEGVSSIGESAFTNCVSLTSVTIPSSVLSIGKNAFNTCKLLSSAIISEGVKTIGESAFYECGSLSSIIIPSSVASIGNGAFSYCKKLSSLTISEGVGSIGNSAFSVCNSISSVTIPSSVKTIGDFAFNNCEILNSVIISEGVKSIGSNSFSWCPALISVEISSSVKSIGNSAFEVCKKLSSVTISEGVTSIGEYAFISCISLTSVFIPSSVISIGKKAFSNCVNLSSVIAGASIPIDLSYSDEVFSGINKNNCKLYVPSDSKYLYVVASQWKDFINIVEISGVFLSSNSIGMGHRASTALMNLVSNLSWTASSDQAWLIINPSSGSGGINTITFTSTTNPTVDTRIAKVTISAKGISPQEITLSQLGNVEVTAGNLKNIIGEQFSNITNLDLTGTIDARDFKTMRDDMPLLADLDLSGVEIVAYSGTDGTESNKTESTDYPANAIPYYAFTNLEDLEKTPSLKSIILPLSATSINRNAFHGCSKLTSITIPPSILSIEEYAFAYCDALGSITIPSSTISIGSGVFISSSGFLTVDEKNPNYSSSEGVFYNKNKTTLINCPISKTGNYNIPATVTSIEGYAFFSCNRLTLVTIPSSVLSIGFYAFWGCSGLTSINIPSSVTTLGSNALRFCSSLTSITTARFLPLNLADYDFMGIKINTCILYVPYGSKAAYQAAIQWKEFENIVEMPNNAPIANAGLDEVVNENALAILDGTGSSDADGNILTYYWTAPTGITLSSVTAAKPTFTAPEVTTDKTFTFSLVVNNGTVYSPVDQVVVVVRQVDKAPHVLNSIENVSVDKRAPGQIIDLKTVFADDDFGDVLSYSVSSNSNNQVVTVSITGSELSLSFSTANTGISDIVITASSNGKEVQSKFQVEVKVPTGIADVANGHEVQIYPNPTKGKLYLKFNHIPEAGTILEVYSASGNLIHKSFINSQDKTLNLNGNSPGVYFIRIGEKDIRTTRIVLE